MDIILITCGIILLHSLYSWVWYGEYLDVSGKDSLETHFVAIISHLNI